MKGNEICTWLITFTAALLPLQPSVYRANIVNITSCAGVYTYKCSFKATKWNIWCHSLLLSPRTYLPDRGVINIGVAL